MRAAAERPVPRGRVTVSSAPFCFAHGWEGRLTLRVCLTKPEHAPWGFPAAGGTAAAALGRGWPQGAVQDSSACSCLDFGSATVRRPAAWSR